MPTLIGAIAPISWSFIPILVYLMENMESLIMLFTSLTFFVATGLIFIATKKQKNKYFKQPLGYYLNATFGILGFHFFYFEALKIAATMPVFLIINLAGILGIFYAAIINKVELQYKHIIAILINFSAVILIILGAEESSNIKHSNPTLGYFYAFIAANCWAIYTSINRRKYSNTPILSVIPACIIVIFSIIPILFLQENIDKLLLISNQQLLICFILGMAPIGYSFIFWNYGVTKGDIRIMSIISYINPILATIWVVAYGIEQFRIEMIFALFMIISGSYISANRFFGRTVRLTPLELTSTKQLL